MTNLCLDFPGRRLLDGLDLRVQGGTSVAVMGPSGSGKTSLLNCIAGLVHPAAGTVVVDGIDMTAASASTRARSRLARIGIVFQFGELLPELSAGDNVALPLLLMGRHDARAVATTWLDRVGMAGMFDRVPNQLSGGEVQRVGIARALAPQPALLLADEPTGALDRNTAREITVLLVKAAKDYGAAVIVATHDAAVADAADRVEALHEGRLYPTDPALR